jgi:hypothetical protein
MNIHTHKAKKLFFIVCMGAFSGVVNAAELEISVYPDSNPPVGTFVCVAPTVINCAATLPNAIALIQNTGWQSALAGKYSLVRLRLVPGIHRLIAPIVLNNWGNGATSNVQLEIMGAGFNTVISGAQLISNWKLAQDSDLPRRTAAVARGKLWMSDVSSLKLSLNDSSYTYGFYSAINPIFTDFFIGDSVQPVASWPNTTYGNIVRSSNIPTTDKNTFAVKDRNVNDWANEPNLQVFAYWFWDWADNTFLIPSANIDTSNGVIRLPGTGSSYGIKNGQRLKIRNSLFELDSPGEWYLDRTTAKLYFWPSNNFSENDSELSVSTQLLQMNNVKNVLIHDFLLEKVRGDAVVVNTSDQVIINNVRIHFTGNRAVFLNKSTNSGMSNSVIEDTGQGGIWLDGGDRQTLTPANNFLKNSVLQRFNRFAKTYKPAVYMSGVGQCVLGNKISDAPHNAILFSGNDHTIANNEIFNVVNEASDMGAIYSGRDWTAQGTLIVGNYLHDIVSTDPTREVKGVYIDDQQSGVTVRGNIFARVQQPTFIGGGRSNVIEGNLYYKSEPAIYLDARGLNWQKTSTLDPNWGLLKNLNAVPYRGSIYSSRYPNLADILTDNLGSPKYNVAQNNLVINGVISKIDPVAGENGIQLTNNLGMGSFVLTNPSPVNPSDFKIASGSQKLIKEFVIPKVADLVTPYKCSGPYK